MGASTLFDIVRLLHPDAPIFFATVAMSACLGLGGVLLIKLLISQNEHDRKSMRKVKRKPGKLAEVWMAMHRENFPVDNEWLYCVSISRYTSLNRFSVERVLYKDWGYTPVSIKDSSVEHIITSIQSELDKMCYEMHMDGPSLQHLMIHEFKNDRNVLEIQGNKIVCDSDKASEDPTMYYVFDINTKSKFKFNVVFY